MKQSGNIDKYKIIKEIAHGMFGTVYLVKKDNKKYAMKIEKVLKKEINPNNKKSKLNNEIKFMKSIVSKHPTQFTQLLEYDIVKDCKHIQQYAYDPSIFHPKKQKILNDLQKSKYCIRKIYTLVDNNLKNIIESLTVKQMYSMIIQLYYALYILYSKGYVHGDFHMGNIGVIKTKIKHINIFNNKIQTFGYIYKLIDYDDIKHIKSNTPNYDIESIKYFTTNTIFWNYVRENNIVVNFDDVYELFKQTTEYDFIKQFTNNKHDQMYLFHIIYTDKHNQYIAGNNAPYIPINMLIPFEDILFLIQNCKNVIMIVNYFTKKLIL